MPQACVAMQLSMEEACVAATLNSAHSIERGETREGERGGEEVRREGGRQRSLQARHTARYRAVGMQMYQSAGERNFQRFKPFENTLKKVGVFESKKGLMEDIL